MAFDTRLVNKGRGEPLDGLVQQAKVHLGLAKAHAEALASNGWPSSKTAKLEQGIATLDSNVAARADAQGDAKQAVKLELAAIAKGKAFIRRLRNALPTVLRDTEVAGVSAESFTSGKLGRSTPKLSAYLTKISGAVEKLDESLKEHFHNQKASELLATLKKAIDAADTHQEVTATTLPEETLRIYEAKGQVLDLIEDLNRAARNAFDGQAELASAFNKDILLRGRGEPAKKAGEDEVKK